MVTSASPREGKTTTAMNLAAVAAQHGQRVLVIDCDFHQDPSNGGAALTTTNRAVGLTERVVRACSA